MENIDPNDMLLVQARRCRRCGGLLTSEEALRDGIGRACKLLERQEQESRRWEEENQYSLFTPPPKNKSGPPGVPAPGEPKRMNV